MLTFRICGGSHICLGRESQLRLTWGSSLQRGFHKKRRGRLGEDGPLCVFVRRCLYVILCVLVRLRCECVRVCVRLCVKLYVSVEAATEACGGPQYEGVPRGLCLLKSPVF